MKDNSLTPVVERHGTFKESKFGIASNEDLVYIFDILRNKLYSDKILAVVREYTTNAMDANVENGLPNEPIVITSPSAMTPAFKVRDFGKGLSEDEIRSVYCMYGRSTKRNSNDFTGQLGLGSKSGFAYGDSFSITSFKDGVKSVYTAYIDESKLGAIAKVSESNTTERPGIEITIPTKSSDVTQFQDRIARVARFFKVAPKINGSVIVEPLKTNFRGSFWSLLSSENPSTTYGVKPCFAVMGNISYPIDPFMVFPDMRNTYSYSGKVRKEYALLVSNTILEFDIGELSIAASREELEYNSQTIQAIKSKAKLAAEDLGKQIDKNVRDCQDFLEAQQLVSKLSDSCGTSVWGSFSTDVKWQGKSVNTFIGISENYGVTIDAFRFYGSKVNRTNSISTIHIDRNLDLKNSFWINDDSSNCVMKMKQMAFNNPNKIFYLIRCGKSSYECPNGDISKEGYENLIKFILPEKYLNKISTYNLEKVVSDKVVVRVKKPKGTVTVYTLNPNGTRNYGNQSDNWVESAVNKSDVEVYVKLNRFQPVINGHERYAEAIGKIRSVLDHYKIKLPTVYGVKAKDVAAFEKDAVSIENFCVSKLSDCKAFIGDYLANRTGSIASFDVWSGLDFFRYQFRNIDFTKNICGENSVFTNFCSLIQEVKNQECRIIKYPEDLHYCGINMPESFAKDKGVENRIRQAAELVSERYPLVVYIPSHLSSKESQIIFDKICQYANKIDNCG